MKKKIVRREFASFMKPLNSPSQLSPRSKRKFMNRSLIGEQVESLLSSKSNLSSFHSGLESNPIPVASSSEIGIQHNVHQATSAILSKDNTPGEEANEIIKFGKEIGLNFRNQEQHFQNKLETILSGKVKECRIRQSQ